LPHASESGRRKNSGKDVGLMIVVAAVRVSATGGCGGTKTADACDTAPMTSTARGSGRNGTFVGMMMMMRGQDGGQERMATMMRIGGDRADDDTRRTSTGTGRGSAARETANGVDVTTTESRRPHAIVGIAEKRARNGSARHRPQMTETLSPTSTMTIDPLALAEQKKKRNYLDRACCAALFSFPVHPPNNLGNNNRRSDSPSTASSPGELLPAEAAPPSKMDKYFSASYDPRLDVSVADLTDPKTGLIAEGNFDEWSMMLDVLEARKGDRKMREIETEAERRKRKEEKRLKKDNKRRRGHSSSPEIGPLPASMSSAGDGLTEYTKKGSVRPWDAGKMPPT
jgi:hypothetical protein